jgi:two-component system, cell cycle response regulator
MRILVADDDLVTRVSLTRTVEALGYECLPVGDGEAAWQLLQGSGVDVVISDWLMPGLDGTELCRRIRERARPAVDADYVYVILATARSDGPDRLTGMRAGADDYLVKPVDPTELEARLIVAARVTALHRELARHRAELERLNMQESMAARTDPLTRLGNRLRLEEDLAAMRARTERYGHRYCAVLCDIDHFKAYNDAMGHPAGDQALRAVAATIREHSRSGDTAYRYGGEEFVVILPEQTLATAAVAAERLRRSVEELRIPHPGLDRPGVVTLSAGVAELLPGDGTSVERLVADADAALYRAKQLGRNRVQVASASGAG